MRSGKFGIVILIRQRIYSIKNRSTKCFRCAEGFYSLLCTIRPFFILNCFPDLLRSANSERRALLTSRSFWVRSGVINIRFRCSGVEGNLSFLTFRKIATFSSSDSTVIFRSLGFGPPFLPNLIALEMRDLTSSWEPSMSQIIVISCSLRVCA